MKIAPMICALALALATAGLAAEKVEQPVDLVICLDTSNSMDGLIEAAKQKLWDIVNELGRAKPKPHLRVGLYAYGTPAFGSQTGFVKKLTDLTDDLDAVYGHLTALRTAGGDEYVARVVRAANLEQAWSQDKKALKIIVVAGNEPATQDRQFDSLEMAKQAVTAGIVINTIYCGNPGDNIAPGWRAVAQAADGQFASIDQDRGTVVVSTPFDTKLAELSGSINKTYVGYGRGAAAGYSKQQAADAASWAASPSAAASRAGAKASGQYRNSTWDLVDARDQKDFDLAKLKEEDLPEQMKTMTVPERQAYLEAKAKERAALQQQINDLSKQRAQYIADELKKSGKSTDKAFDAAMLKAVRDQAQRKGMQFEPAP